MTTVSANQATRIRRVTTPVNRVGARGLLATMLLALLAVLVVDNHLMALPGRSFADIGVSGAALHDPVRSLVPSRRAAPEVAEAAGAAGAAAAGAVADAAGPRGATGRSAHELHRCFVHARRSGQDPDACRTGP